MKRLFRRRSRGPALACHEVRDLMHAFLDGELDDSQTGLVADHLDRCADCGVEAETFLQVKRAISALRTPTDPDALARLEAKVDEITAAD